MNFRCFIVFGIAMLQLVFSFETGMHRSYDIRKQGDSQSVIKVTLEDGKTSLLYTNYISDRYGASLAWEDNSYIALSSACGSPCWYWILLDLKKNGNSRQVHYPIGKNIERNVIWYQLPPEAIFAKTNLIVNFDPNWERGDLSLVIENYKSGKMSMVFIDGMRFGGILNCLNRLLKSEYSNGYLVTLWKTEASEQFNSRTLKEEGVSSSVSKVVVNLSLLE